MVAILEKTKHNIDFHQIMDFLESCHIWVETMDEETKILPKVNGRQMTVSKSSIRRHLKLNDEEGISTLPDNELFENLSLIATNRTYNFSAMPNEASPRVTSLGGGESRGCSKHRGMDQGEDLLVGDTMKDGDKSADKGSDSTDDMANVLGTLGAANILANRGLSKKDKGKGKMTEPEQPSKEKVLEQMSVQLARDLEARGVTILVSEPGYETVGFKDLTCEDWMVNTRTDTDLSAAVQNALQTLLPQIREEIHEEFRIGSGSSNTCGNPPPTRTETSTEFMQRFLRLAGFLGAAAGTQEEQAKNFQWGLRRSTLNHLMCMSYTDVAQVSNAARNYDILHERDDEDTERPDKR
nr:zinc finger, CCHC-type, retrotransposon Gag domain protein [Tanacetum cinerariifolium]